MQEPTGVADYEGRIGRVQAAMVDAGVDLLILDFSADFTYLTGIPYHLANPTRWAFPSEWLRAAILTPTRGPIVAETRGELYAEGDNFQSEVADRPCIADLQDYDGHSDPSETAKALLSQFGQPSGVAVSISTEARARGLPFSPSRGPFHDGRTAAHAAPAGQRRARARPPAARRTA